MVSRPLPPRASIQSLQSRANPSLQGKEAQLEAQHRAATNEQPPLQVAQSPATAVTSSILLPQGAAAQGFSLTGNTVYYQNPNSPNASAVAVSSLHPSKDRCHVDISLIAFSVIVVFVEIRPGL